MILSEVFPLCAFPHEKLGIFLSQDIDAESNASTSFAIRDNTYIDGDVMKKWRNAPTFDQVGITYAVLSSQVISGIYDDDKTDSYQQTHYSLEIPADYPLFVDFSNSSDRYGHMSFHGGLTAIAVFPTNFYPIIQGTSIYQSGSAVNNSFTLSAVLSPYIGLENVTTRQDYYESLDPATLYGISGNIASLREPVIKVNNQKRQLTWMTTTKNTNLLGSKTASVGSKIPAVSPFDTNILPQSFIVTFPLSTSYLEDSALLYSVSVDRNTSATAYSLSGVPIEDRDVLDTTSTLYRTTNNQWNLYLKLKSNFQIPAQSDVLLTYCTSATPIAATTSFTKLDNNYYSLSTNSSIFDYIYTFPISGRPVNRDMVVYFHPSANTVHVDISSVNLLLTMTDNYWSTNIPIEQNTNNWFMNFRDTSGDITLSASPIANTDIVYVPSTWIPVNAPLKFINDGNVNTYDVALEFASLSGAYYRLDPITFTLNGDKALIQLTQLSATPNSIALQSIINPSSDPNDNIKWSVSPSANAVIWELVNGERTQILPHNTLTVANDFSVEILNLGVEPTTISMYSEQYNTSGSIKWYPTSASFANISLLLDGTFENNLLSSKLKLKPTILKNGLIYDVPESGSVIWNENNNADIQFQTASGENFFENIAYPGIQKYIQPQALCTANSTPDNPSIQAFNIALNVFSSDYNLSQNRIFNIRDYPSQSNIYASLSGSNGQVLDSREYESIFFVSSSVNVSASAILEDFSSYGEIRWLYPDNTIHTGISATFPLTATHCMRISAIDAIPKYGGFGAYDFTDEICINVLGSTPRKLEFIAFPEYKFQPTTKLNIEDNTYLSSGGLRYLRPCGTQNFIISTFGGFDQYIYKIGTKQVSSTSNIETIGVTFSDISPISSINVSAFNNIFVPTDPITIYNGASSTGTTVFNGWITPRTPQTINPSIILNTPDLNLSINKYAPFIVNVNYVSTNYTALSTNAVWVLSSAQTGLTSVSDELSFTGNSFTYNNEFNFDKTNQFHITENSYNVFTLSLSGNMIKTPANYPYDTCPITQKITTNVVTLTAYDGPYLEIFSPRNIYATSEMISISNQTPDIFDHFDFTDGTNTGTTTLSGASEPIYAQYLNEGTYTPSMTGYYADGRSPIIRTWPNYFLIRDSFPTWDKNIIREFPDQITLPYNLNDIQISPNDWQLESVLNSTINKINTNIVYLSSMAYTYNSVLPKQYIGWLGERNATLQWHWDNTFATPIYSDKIHNIGDVYYNDGKFYIIDDDTIKIWNNDFTVSLGLSARSITPSEVFVKPIRIVYNNTNSKIVVLDKDKKSIYAFEDDMTLAQYWGGSGPAYSHIHLNKPMDMTIDTDDNIYIVDQGEPTVKIYNAYFNWIGDLRNIDWAGTNIPLAVAANDSYIAVLTESGQVYLYDSTLNLVRTFTISTGTKIYFHNELLYVISGSIIKSYTIYGLRIGSNILTTSATGLAFNGNEMYISNPYGLTKYLEYLEPLSVDTHQFYASAWSIDSMLVTSPELVSPVVYNDTFKKLNDNIYLLAKDIQYKFVAKYDSNFELLSHTIDNIRASEISLSALNYSLLGINELVTWDTINRSIDGVYNNLLLLQDMLQVRDNFTQGPVCWTWNAHTITSPQNTSDRINPYSWWELTDTNKLSNPLLSSITWNTAVSPDCQTESTIYPYSRTWNVMGSNCLVPTTWADLSAKGITWDDLANNCVLLPSKRFTDCMTVCK